MADIKAKRCDKCGEICLAEDITKKAVKFQGLFFGQRTDELCPKCAEEEFNSQKGFDPIKIKGEEMFGDARIPALEEPSP